MGVTQRREREKEGLREEILAAARTLFVEHGYESVSIRKIADKIEYSPGTIYLYFRDKAEILERICEETFAKLDRKMAALQDEDGKELETLRRGLRMYIHFGLENPHHYLLTFGTPGLSSHHAAGVKSNIAQVGLRSFECLRSRVQKCIDAGSLACQDVDEISQALWAGIHGITSLLITCDGFPFIGRERLIERVLTTLVAGIQAS